MPPTVSQAYPKSIASVAPNRSRTGWRLLLASIASAALMWLSYFPVSCGWLAWFALVPWLMLVRAELPKRRRYFYAWLGAYTFFVPSLEWMRAGDTGMVYLWLLLALYCSWYWVAALWLIRRFDRRTRLPLTVTVPIVWTAVEFARAELMGGFSFYLLGQTQHAALPVIQIADIAGVPAVTFLVAAVNGLLAEAVSRIPTVRRWLRLPSADYTPALRRQFLALAGVIVLVLGYGGWRLTQEDFAPGPRVALLQTSIPQTDRNAASIAAAGDPLARTSIKEQTARLTKNAVSGPDRPDLIIWPETTFPTGRKEIAPGAPELPELAEWRKDIPEHEQLIRDMAQLSATNVLLGLNIQVLGVDGKLRRYNSALLLTPRGEAVGRYDKIHRVPFGEYIPFRDEVPWVQRFSPYGEFDYTITPGAARRAASTEDR